MLLARVTLGRLQIPPAKRKLRKAVASQPGSCVPTGMNTVWSYDFVVRNLRHGQLVECLAVVDEYTRECLAIDAAGSICPKPINWCCQYNEVRSYFSLNYLTPRQFGEI